MEEKITEEMMDLNFKYEVIKEPGGDALMKCFACGTCTLSCPVRAMDDTYNPRRIIRMTLLGLKDEVLKSDFIWLCSTCYLCYERCPQDVKVTDLMDALKNLAVKYGYIHPSYVQQLNLLRDHGRLYEVGDFENKKRAKLNLPELKERPEEIKEILDKTDILKYTK